MYFACITGLQIEAFLWCIVPKHAFTGVYLHAGTFVFLQDILVLEQPQIEPSILSPLWQQLLL
jgi:hypothetical protein